MSRDHAFDAGDEAQAATQAEEHRLAGVHADARFKRLMASKAGRDLMWALLERCGVFRTSFSASRPDPLVTAFLEGERNIGLEYLHRIHRLCPDHYLAMLKDRLAEEPAHSGGGNP